MICGNILSLKAAILKSFGNKKASVETPAELLSNILCKTKALN